MTILGIGIDILNNERIKKIWNKYNDNFVKKILNEKETITLSKKKNKLQFLSKIFATKEAFVKAIGIGFRNGVTFKSINVSSNSLGRPIIEHKLKIFEKTDTFISISHEKETTIAIVVITKKN